MIMLEATIIIWMVVLGTSYSQDLDSPDLWVPPATEKLSYRPWENNETSAGWISLEGMGLRRFDSSFQLHFNELPRWLVLDRNEIADVSPEVFKSLGGNLTYVSMAQNRISGIGSAALGYLKKLRVLDLDGNPIQLNAASDILCNSASLESLYLRHCDLYSFELPSCENSLTHLHLSGNRIKVFYTKSDSLLTHLYLNDNELRYVTLSQLDWLVHLNVSNNKLRGIVRYSRSTPAIDAQNFETRSRGYWATPSVNEHNLHLDRAAALQYLILSFNSISEIEPTTFEDITELVHIDIRNNKISQLRGGTFENLLELEDILLDGNQISRIDRDSFLNLPKLKLLSLKNNEIVNFEGNVFANVDSLTKNLSLFLDDNKIEILGEGSFKGMTGLKHVGLSGNRLKTISSEAFVDLPHLRNIEISNQWYNESEGISERLIRSNAFSNLPNVVSIEISRNSFTGIESGAFHGLAKLTTLDLSRNFINNISSQAFLDLPKLEDLNLEVNKLLRVEPRTFPNQLKRLNLAWNPPREGFSTLNLSNLDQLEELDISGTIRSFEIEELSTSPKNLNITIGRMRP